MRQEVQSDFPSLLKFSAAKTSSTSSSALCEYQGKGENDQHGYSQLLQLGSLFKYYIAEKTAFRLSVSDEKDQLQEDFSNMIIQSRIQESQEPYRIRLFKTCKK